MTPHGQAEGPQISLWHCLPSLQQSVFHINNPGASSVLSSNVNFNPIPEMFDGVHVSRHGRPRQNVDIVLIEILLSDLSCVWARVVLLECHSVVVRV